MTDIAIPAGLKPADGRFGCGPSKIRPEQLTALAASSATYLGTSHRQAPVRSLVQRAREGLAELFAVPDGYQVVLGNGGTTAFWEIAAFGLIRQKSQHLAFGEFSAKFGKVAQAAPWLDDPTVIASPPGTHPVAARRDRGGHLRADPQRDLHRRGHARPPGDGTATPGPWSSWMRRAAPAASPSMPASVTCTTSRRRSASAPTAGCGSR